MATTFYQVNKNTYGINSFGSAFSNACYSCSVSATTDTTLDVPTTPAIGMAPANQQGNYLAVFHYPYNVEMWVAVNATAAVPAGHTFAATTSVMNPTGKIVNAGDVLHFYSTAGGDVSVEFFSTQEN